MAVGRERTGYDTQTEAFRSFLDANRRVTAFDQPGQPIVYGVRLDGWDPVTNQVECVSAADGYRDRTSVDFETFVTWQLMPFGVGNKPTNDQLASWGQEVQADVVLALQGQAVPSAPPAEPSEIPRSFVIGLYRSLAAQLLADGTADRPEQAVDMVIHHLSPTIPSAPEVLTPVPTQPPFPVSHQQPTESFTTQPVVSPLTRVGGPLVSPQPEVTLPSDFSIGQPVRVQRSNLTVEGDWVVFELVPGELRGIGVRKPAPGGGWDTKHLTVDELRAMQTMPVSPEARPQPELNTAINFQTLAEFSGRQRLEPQAIYEEMITRGTELLGRSEGIVELPKDVPTIVMPDIHGRRDFVVRTLNQQISGADGVARTVFELLEQGKINLLCVGDYFHTENQEGARRWIQIDSLLDQAHANQDQTKLEEAFQVLDQEMLRDLGLVKMLIDLKTRFPNNVQLLRGNHESINPPKGEGYSKHSQIGESKLVKAWVERRFGEPFLQRYARFEDQLPLMAVGKDFVASHAAPARPLERAEIATRNKAARLALTWTDNTMGQTSERFMDETLENIGALDTRAWLVGHRPVNTGLYRDQFDGKLIQINHADQQVVAFVPADRQFNPVTDVFKIG